jgi:hypothetical protein
MSKTRDFREMPVFINALIEASRDVLVQLATNVKERMSEEGKPVRYPINWDSEKQRRAFFATNGFGKGIPYRRSNRYRLGWEMERGRFGVRLSNRSPAGAVGGTTSGWQSRIHRGRWPHLLSVLFDELRKVPADLSNRLRVVGNR